VVEFRDAPPPGMPPEMAAAAGLDPNAAPAGSQTPAPGATGTLPDGATQDAISAALAPSPGGNVIYYRVD
jgi:hypothetical protein